ncbi:MAG: BrnT family toxin [Roseiarcus sp.]|jgi:uncharacterized DUF497 family protein
MVITWDNAKRLANIFKHGLDFADLDEDFFGNAVIVRACPPRFTAIGGLRDAMAVVVIFAPLGAEAVSVIPMRPANKKERSLLHAP